MHVEFVVVGVPISNQSAGSALTAWRAAVETEARKNWTGAPLTGKLKVVVINFHLGDKPSLDLDNMSKPILDALQQIVYDDDRQIRQVELAHVRIDSPLVFVGVPTPIATSVQAGKGFVYVRIEDPIEPLPLPTK